MPEFWGTRGAGPNAECNGSPKSKVQGQRARRPSPAYITTLLRHYVTCRCANGVEKKGCFLAFLRAEFRGTRLNAALDPDREFGREFGGHP
jgi:hypothetical protein